MVRIDKDFITRSMGIIIPVALQNLIFSTLNMVDTLMIGQLGEESIAGVSLANQYFFILTLLFFGVTGGTSVFTSQFWGAKQIDKIKNVLGTAIKIVFVSGLIFTLIGHFFPKQVIRVFTNDKEVIEIGSQYLKTVSLCYIFAGLSFIFTGVLRSIGQVKLPTIISAISLSLNTIINYLLIFGHFGFPKLGVQGAAIATLISRIFEFVIIIAILKAKKSLLVDLNIKDFTLHKELKKKFYSKVIPVVTNETAWALGAAGYSAIYARIGTDSVAAFQIQQTITTMFLIFVFGTGNASAILIGNKLGEGEKEAAFKYGKWFIIMSILIGLFTGILIHVFSPFLIPLFNVKESVIATARTLIFIFSIVLVFKSLNITMVVGVLRGGGDTKVAMFMDIFGVWLIGIPLGLLGAFIFKFPIEYVYILVSIEEIIKGTYGIIRYRSKRWINVLIH